MLTRYGVGEKFEVNYDDMDKLKTYQVTELPSHRDMYGYVAKEFLQKIFVGGGQWMVNGAFDLPEENSLNKMFPEIKTMGVDEMLELSWKGNRRFFACRHHY